MPVLLLIKHIAELDAETASRLLQAIVVIEQGIGEVVRLYRYVVSATLYRIHQVGIMATLLWHIEFSTLACP